MRNYFNKVKTFLFETKEKLITEETKQFIDKNKKGIKTGLVVLFTICFFAFDLGSLLKNVWTSITSILTNETEIKTVEFTSDGYDDKEQGSYKITKHADWTSQTTARITWTMESYIERDSVKKDIILVLDTSTSMEGSKLSVAKKAIKKLIDEIFLEEGNTLALVTFNSSATTLTGFTNNKEELNTLVDAIKTEGDTNYNRALIKVDELLSSYEVKSNRQVEVIFIVDGYPNVEKTSQEARYEQIKKKYPDVTIHGIQYEMGNEVVDVVKKVSDKQYIANTANIVTYLIEAAFTPELYEIFEITDYIDNNYFTIEKMNDISSTIGKIDVTKEGDVQKIVWRDSGDVVSGTTYTMTVDIKLKDEFVKKKGLYPVSTKEIVKIKLPGGEIDEYDTNEVPKLKAPYKVKYEANAPEGCNTKIDIEFETYAFDNVELSNEKITCPGYQFKGWDVVEDVTMLNDTTFVMPTEDVVIRGTWTKINLVKTLEGTVFQKLSLYKTIANQAVPDNEESEFVSSSSGINFSDYSSSYNGRGVYTLSTTLNDEYPIHYYRGKIDNNHVIFAGFCWEIVRTTDTGGVKIIYDGVPTAKGYCTNTNADSQLSQELEFNTPDNYYHYDMLGSGYMYNKLIKESTYYYDKSIYNYDSSKHGLTKYNYYFGDSVTYDENTKKYTLNNAQQYTWESNYKKILGYYTCFSETTTSCSSVYYLTYTYTSYGFYITLSGGNMLDDVDNWVISDAITKKADGTYELKNPIVVKRSEWGNIYKDYKNFYGCPDRLSLSCSDVIYFNSTSSSSASGPQPKNDFIYGNSFEYDESTGQYRLIDTEQYWNTYKISTSKAHYTCFNSTGVCNNTIYYILSNPYDSSAYYIELKNGETISQVFEELFIGDYVNKNDSTIKKYIDEWYSKNLLEYTKYLENTIWCNDRRVYDTEKTVFNPNAEVFQSSGEYFISHLLRRRKPAFYCSKNDSFTLSVENGGIDNYGNNKLTYPVALLTAEELNMAGLVGQYSSNLDSYIGSTQVKDQDGYYEYFYTWTMSPYTYDSIMSWSYSDNYHDASSSELGVRPSISLRPGIEYKKGDGSAKNPYVILED